MSVSKAPRARPAAVSIRRWAFSGILHRLLLSSSSTVRTTRQRSQVSILLMALSMVGILLKANRRLLLTQSILNEANSSSTTSSSMRNRDSDNNNNDSTASPWTLSWETLWSAPFTISKQLHTPRGAPLRSRKSLLVVVAEEEPSTSSERGNEERPTREEDVMPPPPPNLHAHYPMVCDDEDRDWNIHPSIPNYLDLVHRNRESDEHEHTQPYTVVGHFASSTTSSRDLDNLAKLQSCTYSLLDQWNQLARRHSIHPWAAHGGSAIGAKCFGSMNPWDDDIDISIWDCTALDRLWKEGQLVNETYPDLSPDEYHVDKPHQSFEARLIENDLILLKGGRCCHWYKLKSVAQVRNRIKAGSDIVGLDLECMKLTTYENQVRKGAGWDAYMGNVNDSRAVDTVMFGPTTIQVMPQPMNDKYIELRYGKKDPCSFPFRSGQDPIPGLLAANRTAPQEQDSDGRLKYLPVIQEHQMHFAMANWYTSRVQRAMWLRRAVFGSTSYRDKLYWQRRPSIFGALNRVEVDSTISMASCPLDTYNRTDIQVLAFNAERGTHWDEWSELLRNSDSISRSKVLVVSNVDVGMARSGNIHTVRRLALALGMNYAFAVEAIELTRGTPAEQEATYGQRDALGLNGHAILSTCRIVNPVVVRDDLPDLDMLSLPSGDRRLGGRMQLFASLRGDGELDHAPSLVVGNSPRRLSNERAIAIAKDYVRDSPALVVGGGDGNNDSSGFCQDLGLNEVFNGHVSVPGCGVFGLPRMHPSSLCSNQPASRPLAIAPCFDESQLGVSALSSHAMATATLLL